MTTSAIGRLNDIGEDALAPAEVADADGAEAESERRGEHEPRAEDVGRPAEERPAEAVDDRDHRVQRVEEEQRLAEARARHLRAIRDRTRVEAELDDERDDEADVAIPHGERGRD